MYCSFMQILIINSAVSNKVLAKRLNLAFSIELSSFITSCDRVSEVPASAGELASGITQAPPQLLVSV